MASPPAPAPAVRVLEQCRVSPYRDGPPETREVSLPLTFFDVFYVGAYHLKRLLLYRWPGTTADFVASALPQLKRSLSSTLRYFYPLAGRLRCLPGGDKFDIYCTDGDSVPFTLAEGDGDFCRIAGDQPYGAEELRSLVPQVPAAGYGDDGGGLLQVMALQVTVFPGGGVCVGVAIHHAACDGSAYTRFLRSWASACRSAEGAAPAVELPAIDRTLVSDPNGLYAAFLMATKDYKAIEQPPAADGVVPYVVRSTFLLRRGHIEGLRRLVSGSHPQQPPTSRYSSFVLTCAYVWVTLLKARRAPLPGPGEAAHFSFMVDCRHRLNPALPAAYFGNCLAPCFVEAARSDLVGEKGVRRAAEAIAQAIGGLGEATLLRGAEGWIHKFVSLLPRGLLTVAGSPRFGVYGVDFGWGRPEKVELVDIERSASFSLAESREEDGGVEIGVALPAHEMEEFGSLFAAGLVVV